MTFNLSNEIISDSYWDKEGETRSTEYSFRLKDVKEFIKELKDDLHLNISTSPLINKIIDELAGDELI